MGSTIIYSHVGLLDIHLDPKIPPNMSRPRPTIVHFHGGGVVGEVWRYLLVFRKYYMISVLEPYPKGYVRLCSRRN